MNTKGSLKSTGGGAKLDGRTDGSFHFLALGWDGGNERRFERSLPFALDGREGCLPGKIKCQPLDKHWCSIAELSSRRAAGSVHLHFPPTSVSFDTQHRPGSFPPSVPSRGCVWRAMPGGCRCFGCIVHTSAVGMVKDRTGRWRGCPVGNTRAVGLSLGLELPPKVCHAGALGAAGRAECFPGVWQPRTTPGDSAGAPRGWLRIFAQILLVFVAAVQSQVEVHPGLQNSHPVPPG